MIEFILSEKEFELCMEYCMGYRDFGSFKYLYEISIPDNEFGTFLEWLNNCEKANLSFVFFILDRYKGYKLLYGFSNFEVQKTGNMKYFDFSFQNNDMLYDNFWLWYEESTSVIMPASIKAFLNIINLPAKKVELKVITNENSDK